MIYTVFIIFQYIILVYLTIQVIYLFFFSVAGKIAKKKSLIPAIVYRKIRIFIPGYKEDSVIIATAISALQHNYPTHLFEVVIIADSFSVATLIKNNAKIVINLSYFVNCKYSNTDLYGRADVYLSFTTK